MAKWRHIGHICLVTAVVLLVVMWALDVKNILPFDFNKVALLLLIFVNFAYTISTEVMARTMEQQRNEAVAPVVQLDAIWSGDIEVHFLNVGVGPALNFRCWVEDREYPDLRSRQRCISRRAVSTSHSDVGSTGVIQTGFSDYHSEQGYIRAQYEDVFGLTYESCLIFPSNALPQLKYGRAKEIVRL